MNRIVFSNCFANCRSKNILFHKVGFYFEYIIFNGKLYGPDVVDLYYCNIFYDYRS